MTSADFYFFLMIVFIYFYFFSFGCSGSPLLHGFFWLWLVGASVSCGGWASPCSGSSCCGARALGHLGSAAVAPRLWSVGSVVVAHGLSSPACAIFPDQGSNPCLLHWSVDSLPPSHLGKLGNTLCFDTGKI